MEEKQKVIDRFELAQTIGMIINENKYYKYRKSDPYNSNITYCSCCGQIGDSHPLMPSAIISNDNKEIQLCRDFHYPLFLKMYAKKRQIQELEKQNEYLKTISLALKHLVYKSDRNDFISDGNNILKDITDNKIQ